MSLLRPVVPDIQRVIDAFRTIPTSIVPEDDLNRAARVLRELPTVPWWLILETRVLGEAPATDLFAGVLRTPEAVETLAGEVEAPSAHPRFFSAWADPQSPASDSNVMWFEWDAPMVGQEPLVWYSLDVTFWPQAGRSYTGVSESDRLAHLRTLAGAPEAPERWRVLSRVVESVPRQGRIFGSMWMGRARGRDRDRMFVNLPSNLVMDWLSLLEWPGDRHRARAWLDQISPPGEWARVQIEVSDRVEPYLAIETLQADLLPPDLDEVERQYLENLVCHHHAPRDHIDALRAWRCIKRSENGPTERRSFHVKAVLRPDAPPVVKGYFGVCFTSV